MNMVKDFLSLLKSEKGNQSLKSAIGIFVFVIFIVASVLFNNSGVPLSYRVAFGSSHGGSGGGGGGGGGGSVSVSGTYAGVIKNEVSFNVSKALGFSEGVKPNDGTVMAVTVPAERVPSTAVVKLNAVSHGSSSVNGLVGSLPSNLSAVNDNLLSVKISDSTGNNVVLSGTIEIKFEYASEQVKNKDVSSLIGYRWDSANSNWEPLPTKVSVDGVVRVNVTTSKTSYFTVLGKPGKGIPPTQATTSVGADSSNRIALIASVKQQLTGLIAQVLALLQDSVKSGKTISPEAQKQLASLSISSNIAASSDDLPPPGLSKGDKGNDVKKLQKLLIKWGTGPIARLLAETGATGYYGNLTSKAVCEFQDSRKEGKGPAAGALGDALHNVPCGAWGRLTRAAAQEPQR